MSDFLLELRSEEIPARMQAGARASLAKLFLAETAARGLHLDGADHHPLIVWSTPRRLTLLAKGLPLATAAVSEEVKGPKVSAPAQALDGFLRKTGLTREQLTERDGVWFAGYEKPGRATADVLAEAIPAIIRSFPWPKSQRWGAASRSTESLRWVRPLSGIVALLDSEVVEFEIDGIHSGRQTLGHRFHSHGEIAIDSPASYARQLRAHHVIVHHAERETIIREGAIEVAREAGLVLVEDEGLVIENAGLTEWPVPLLGRFDEAFLGVPPEVIQLTARTNQKYFICRDKGGKLANAFICTANIVAVDGGAAIVAGNGKVLAARLSDARFFWEQDRKKTLAQHAEGLARITFHRRLGSVADKVARIEKLALWLVENEIVRPLENTPQAKTRLFSDVKAASAFCKADLVTEMVGEFPELQGLIGSYYARAEGLPDAVADAIRDHYKPVGQGDDVPTNPVTVAVSMADKLDTIAAFFLINERPTGSRDPFALRRAAISLIALILANTLRFQLQRALEAALTEALGSILLRNVTKSRMRLRGEVSDSPMGRDLATKFVAEIDSYLANLRDRAYRRASGSSRILSAKYMPFFADRLWVQQKEAGVRHDLIDAVFALGGEDDLVRLLDRVQALQGFIGTEDGTNLLAGYKRAANILKKEGFTAPLPLAGGAGGGPVLAQGQEEEVPTPNPSRKREGDYVPEPAEAALIAALEFAAPRAEEAIAVEDFAGAMAALAGLRAPIDAFFDQVTVNDPDENKRAARLGLLDQFRAAVHKVADFSLIEG